MSDATPTPLALPGRWSPFRIRIRTLIALIAIVAMGLGAWRLLRDDTSSRRAWVRQQIRNLGHEDPHHRRTAIEVLAMGGRASARLAMRPLIATLARDPDPTVRGAAARTLGFILPDGSTPRDEPTAVDVDAATVTLIAALDDPDPAVRLAAIDSLGNLHRQNRGSTGDYHGPDPLPVIRVLARLVRDPDPAVRARMLQQVGQISVLHGDAPGVLLAALEDPDGRVRIAAIEALNQQAEEFYPFSPALPSGQATLPVAPRERVPPWKNADEVARRLAALLPSVHGGEPEAILTTLDALEVTPPRSALPEVLQLLTVGSPDGEDRASLARVLGRYGADARPALPGLVRLAEQEIDPGRYPLPAVEAIFRIDPDSPEAQAMAEALAKLHRDTKHPSIARDVATMLAGLGPSARAALPILRQTAQTGRDPTHREQASRAIEAIEATGD